MGSVARWLVGTAIMFASAHAYGEAQPAPPPQAQPQAALPPQPTPPKNPPAQKNAPPPQKAAPKAASPPVQAKAQPKAPAPKQQPKTQVPFEKGQADSGAQVPQAGDGAASPPAQRCQITPPTGTPIFEARYSSGKKAVITKLYATGTFTRVVLKQSPLRTSCIESDRLGAIRTALAEAPWQTTKSPQTCQAVAAETTAIYAAGKLRFTSRVCSPLVLDVQSSKALDLIGASVGPFGLDMADTIEAN